MITLTILIGIIIAVLAVIFCCLLGGGLVIVDLAIAIAVIYGTIKLIKHFC